MAPLLDLGTAGLGALAVFLIALGVLVVFVEKVRAILVAGIVAGSLVVSLLLVSLEQAGVALIVAAMGGAFLANHVFEWLTTR